MSHGSDLEKISALILKNSFFFIIDMIRNKLD